MGHRRSVVRVGYFFLQRANMSLARCQPKPYSAYYSISSNCIVWQASKSTEYTSTHRDERESLDRGADVHILIVADPQILDHRSYPGRSPFFTFLTRLVVDLNLRKSWRAALRTRPHAVVLLGDMMDGGRFAMSDRECVAHSSSSYIQLLLFFYLWFVIFTIDLNKCLLIQVWKLLPEIQEYLQGR